MRDRIKVLFVAADPFRDLARLELEDEMRAIRRALAQGKAHDTLELEACFGTRTRDLQLALLEYQPQIVHFSGHGDGDGVIYLSDAAGRPAAVGKAALARLFDLLESEVRVVVLNACFSRPQAQAIADVVGCAIGTRGQISDAAAITFGAAFYGAIASGQSVQAAYDQGCAVVRLDKKARNEIPQLLVQPGKDRILGVTIVARDAGEMLAEYVLAMKHGIGLNKMLATVHAYPTMAEANKYAAGEWKKAHKPERLLKFVERYHAWRRA